jgi:hypothetical protein
MIRRALLDVLGRLPKEDRIAITAFVSFVACDASWETLGLGSAINQTAGQLRPFYRQIGAQAYIAQVRFSLPVARLFSARGLRGVVAHEFAHARRAAEFGKGWHETMQRRWRREEIEADALACAWGFSREIKAKDYDRQTVVTPHIASREAGLLRRIDERFQANEREVRERFSRLLAGPRSEWRPR